MAERKHLLILRLEGAMQSWGENAKWDFRDSSTMPTKSGIVGLLGCAMGEERGSQVLLELARSITVAVRADRPGAKFVDFQTVQGDPLMAATGKLVRITELDMGYVGEDGTSVKTEEMTEAQHKAMAAYYKFIVNKYLEIIPVNQQYGIAHWCPTDSPESSSWRGGEPVGLWTEGGFNRKHTFAGFADGLSRK